MPQTCAENKNPENLGYQADRDNSNVLDTASATMPSFPSEMPGRAGPLKIG